MRCMGNEIILASHDMCTGCGACADSCTKNCITMEKGDSIHLYPVINKDYCVSCGACVKKCPATNHVESNISGQKYYMAWHYDDDERKSSTSGGVGLALVERAIEKSWYVCGAAMNDNFELKHILTNDSNEARLLKGSKYLQSDTVGIYKKIRELVDGGESVLFIGTPCQVAGLVKTMPERLMERILTCGIICHGVNSPIVWKEYKNWIEKQNSSKLKEYRFRSKSHGWQKKKGGPNLRVAYSFNNGKSIDQPAWMNLFHSWFGNHYILRPSCLNCVYRRESRNSDITIGDFWGVEKISHNVDTFNGVSAVVSSTGKGDIFIKECNHLHVEEVDDREAIKELRGFIENQTYEQRLKQIEREKSFEKEFIEKGFDAMAQKYPPQNYLSRFVYSIKVKIGLK